MRRTILMTIAALVLAAVPAWAQTWTAPATFTTGQLVTATDLNAQIRDNMLVLRAGGIAVTSQAIGDLLCASSTTQFARLADVATGQVVVSGGVGVCPAYSATLPTAVQDNITRLGTVVAGSFPAANLSGTALPAAVVTSSLTTVGTITSGTWGGAFSDAALTAIDAGTWTGASSITTLGTVTTGVWNAGAVTSSGGISGTTGTFSGKATFAVSTASADVIHMTSDTIGVGLKMGTTGSVNLYRVASGVLASDSSLRFSAYGAGTATFDASGNITSATTLSAATTGSSLTSVGTITTGVWNAGAVTSSGGISGTTGKFSDNAGLAATKKLYLDGVALTGDTYLTESSANVMDLVVGAANSLRLTATTGTFVGDLTAATTSLFSAWTAKSVDTAYLANTDGFVVCYLNGSSPNDTYGIIGLTDASNPPTTTRVASYLTNSITEIGGFTMPVKKGHYYKVTTSDAVAASFTTMWFIGIGTSGA